MPSAEFWDSGSLHQEALRQFDVCGNCRLCVTFCPSFPAMFDAIDDNDGDASALTLGDTFRITELCFLCELCFLRCPYTPPHEWQMDVPDLLRRAKAVPSERAGRPPPRPPRRRRGARRRPGTPHGPLGQLRQQPSAHAPPPGEDHRHRPAGHPPPLPLADLRQVVPLPHALGDAGPQRQGRLLPLLHGQSQPAGHRRRRRCRSWSTTACTSPCPPSGTAACPTSIWGCWSTPWASWSATSPRSSRGWRTATPWSSRSPPAA